MSRSVVDRPNELTFVVVVVVCENIFMVHGLYMRYYNCFAAHMHVS